MRDHGKEWLLSSQWSITSSVRAPRDLTEEVAVETLKPSGVLRLREAANLHHVHLAAVAGVGEGNLFVQIRNKSQRLQVAVELLDFRHGDSGQQLHHVSHSNVVRKSHLVGHVGELSISCMRSHPLRETSA